MLGRYEGSIRILFAENKWLTVLAIWGDYAGLTSYLTLASKYYKIFESGTIEKKRKIIGLYIDKIIAYSESRKIKIALM